MKHSIYSINVKGFKSIKECEIIFKQINVLIGCNGSGKSNFISIFKLLQDIVKKEFQLHVMKAGGANSFLYNGRKNTEKIELGFYFGNNGYRIELVPTDDNKLIFEYEGFHYMGSQYNPGGNYRVASAQEEARFERGVGNKLDEYIIPILKNLNWKVYHFHDTSRSAAVKQAHKLLNNIELNFDANNLAAFLLRLSNSFPKNYEMIRENIKLIAPYFDDFYLIPFDNNEEIILRWKQVGCDDIFNANQFSDGTLRFICLATLLLQPEELKPATIIIDEPELGLHPFAITILSEMMKSISRKTQIIISTQSVELLNEFNANDVIVVDRDDKGSVFKRVNGKDLVDWLEDEYSIGDLWKKNLIGGRFTK